MCRAYRIPHSEFLAWSKSDRDKATWQYVREKERCPRCGTRRSEWLESQGGHRHAYKPVVDRCPGCEQVEYLQDSIDEKRVGKGAFVRLERLNGEAVASG